MAKKVIGIIKLQIPAGQASPAPPVGPALGQYGVNIMDFCKAYNEQTASQKGSIIPVEITVYEDRSFSFVTKTPPAADLLKKALGIEKASGEPHKEKVGVISRDKIREIAEIKAKDLNANDIEAAMRIIEGTARSMGIEVGDVTERYAAAKKPAKKVEEEKEKETKEAEGEEVEEVSGSAQEDRQD